MSENMTKTDGLSYILRIKNILFSNNTPLWVTVLISVTTAFSSCAISLSSLGIAEKQLKATKEQSDILLYDKRLEAYHVVNLVITRLEKKDLIDEIFIARFLENKNNKHQKSIFELKDELKYITSISKILFNERIYNELMHISRSYERIISETLKVMYTVIEEFERIPKNDLKFIKNILYIYINNSTGDFDSIYSLLNEMPLMSNSDNYFNYISSDNFKKKLNAILEKMNISDEYDNILNILKNKNIALLVFKIFNTKENQEAVELLQGIRRMNLLERMEKIIKLNK